MRESQIRFTRQQGFSAPTVNEGLYSALMFQPRLVACVFVVGALFQGAWVFVRLPVILWWSALIPTHNPFHAL
jgi:hypothetical protein